MSVISFFFSFLTVFGFYAVLAFSLGLIFGQLGVVNVAQGDFAMVGAFVMYTLRPLPFVVGIVAALAAGIVLGLLTERLVLARLYDRGFLATLLAMWGVGIVLRQGAEAIFGSTPRSVEAPISGSLKFFGVQYPVYWLVSTLACLTLLGACLLFVYRTDIGLHVRASIDNREMATLLGISPKLMITGTFVSAAALAVVAGALQSPMLGVTPQLGVGFLAPAFFAVLLGRPGTITGPLLGAFLVAFISTTFRYFFSENIAATLFLVSLIVLIAVRPQGLRWSLPRWLVYSRAQ